MMHSLKQTLITFLPIILIFGWLNAHLSYYPLHPGESFTTTLTFQEGISGLTTLSAPKGITLLSNDTQTIIDGKATWSVSGDAGEYILSYTYLDKRYTKTLLITSEKLYKNPTDKIKDEFVESIQVSNRPIKVLNLFGWKVGWLGTYIILSILFSLALRKVLNVY